MHNFMRTAAAVVLAAGIAAPAFAQATTGEDYVKQAGASDKFEITEGTMMKSSSNPQIAAFARKMITDHTKSTAMVKQAAMKDGLTPKQPMLDSQQQSMVSQLRAAKGQAKDALYIQQQKTAHQMALQLHQSFASSGPASASHLKAAAAKIVPVVQSHIDMLNQMPSSM